MVRVGVMVMVRVRIWLELGAKMIPVREEMKNENGKILIANMVSRTRKN